MGIPGVWIIALMGFRVWGSAGGTPVRQFGEITSWVLIPVIGSN